MKTHIIALATIASLAVAPAAFASDKFEFDFKFSPVEVSTEIGAEKVYDALEEMIESKCEPDSTRAKIRERVYTEQCIRKTIEQAVADIDDPALTALHEDRRG